jgi:hypothetical protein
MERAKPKEYRRPHLKVHAAPAGSPWMWTLAFGHHEDRTATHGYDPTREAAMSAFAKSWRREAIKSERRK